MIVTSGLISQYSAGVGWSIILFPIGQRQSSPTVMVTISVHPSVVVHITSYVPAAANIETEVSFILASAITAVPGLANDQLPVPTALITAVPISLHFTKSGSSPAFAPSVTVTTTSSLHVPLSNTKV